MKSSPSAAEVRAILAERLDVLLAECDQVMDNAAFGQTLNALDDFLLVQGRNFIKEVLQQKMQERVERTETSPGQELRIMNYELRIMNDVISNSKKAAKGETEFLCWDYCFVWCYMPRTSRSGQEQKCCWRRRRIKGYVNYELRITNYELRIA